MGPAPNGAGRYHSAAAQHAQARADRFVASATLYKALGGDWEEGTW